MYYTIKWVNHLKLPELQKKMQKKKIFSVAQIEKVTLIMSACIKSPNKHRAAC